MKDFFFLFRNLESFSLGGEIAAQQQNQRDQRGAGSADVLVNLQAMIVFLVMVLCPIVVSAQTSTWNTISIAAAPLSTTLTVSPATVSLGGAVTATWSGIASPSPRDWIGLYKPGAPNTEYLDWRFVSCSQTAGSARASGSCAFVLNASIDAGRPYELRLLSNNSYTVLVTSNTFIPTGPALSASATSVSPGGTVTATWSGIVSPTSKDWIGLYKPGTTAPYYEWIFVSCSRTAGNPRASGSCPFVVPASVPSGTYELRLQFSNGFSTLATSNSFNVTIADNDFPAVSISATDNTAAEAGPDTGTFRVSRTGATTLPLTVIYNTTGSTALPADYSALAPATILAGQSFVDITVTPADDSDVEGPETVVVNLIANAAYTLGSPASATVTIADNDFPAVSISATDNTAAEAGPDTGTFRVSRTGATTLPLTVIYNTTGSTALPADYSALAPATILAEQSFVDITVTPADDSDVEEPETVVVNLIANAAYTLGSPASATVTIADNDSAQSVVAVQVTGDPIQRVDIVIVGDGYTAGESSKFASDTELVVRDIFAQEPFREYRNYFNIRRIDTASAESGADHPESSPSVFKNTAFDATYNCSGIDRLICVNTTKVLDAVSILPPSQRDLMFIIVNDPIYGGSGGSVIVTSTNAAVVEIALHETGHTLGLLADEYTTQPPNCVDSAEPDEANATRQTDRASIKWNAWIDSATALPTTTTAAAVPGLYVGSKYCPATLFRPTYNSKMRSLGVPFEQINTEQLVLRFYNWVRPIESQSPASTTLTLPRISSQQFSIDTPRPLNHSLTIRWELDGQPIGSGLSYLLSGNSVPSGSHTVTVLVTDETSMVRVDSGSVLRHEASWNVTVSGTDTTETFSFVDRGAASFVSSGASPATVAGYAAIRPNAGRTAPAGLAIFGFRQNNVLVTEAGVAASPLLQSGRIYAEVNGPVNTGLAIANPGAQPATVSFFYTDSNGDFGSGSIVIPANEQKAAFLDQPPFNSRPSLKGTLTFNSSVPVAAAALRGLTNERGEFLITALPVDDLSGAPSPNSVVLPHFADGGGWTTQIILVNRGDTVLTGSVQFQNSAGGAATVTVTGQTNTAFPYVIPARSSQSLLTSGTGTATVSGSVRILPSPNTAAPSGLAVFSLRNGAITVTEAGVLAAPAGTAFQFYAEASGGFGRGSIQTGLAVANTSPNTALVTVELSKLDGSSTGLTGSFSVPGSGQLPIFLNQIQGFAALPTPFQGIMRVSSPSPISVAGLRARYNERGDFLVTTTPPVNEAATAPTSPVFFPHIVDSGGYTTQFILFSGQSGQSSAGVMEPFWKPIAEQLSGGH